MLAARRVAVWATAVACLALALAPAGAQAPLKVGDHFPIRIASHGDSDVEGTATRDGKVFTLTHPGATYIALHFEEMDLEPGSQVRITDGKGGQSHVLRGRGRMELGTFWAPHVKGDTVVIRLFSRGPQDGTFLIDEYAAGFVNLGGTESICGTKDTQNAICYAASNPTEYARARAVARLLIQGSSLCTGWLASVDSHLITNEHCISSATAALNTDYEFDAEAPNCGDTNCQLCHPGVIFSASSFIQDSPALDYALVQLAGSPAATYGFLSIDDRQAVVGEEIYLPQHPAGRAKEFGIDSTHADDQPSGVCHVVSLTEPGCSSGAAEVGYYCDTEGGSSGTPVLARSSHQVIALHHCRGANFCPSNTGGDPNRAVPIDSICAEICSILNTGCTTDADCDDGNSCTADTCDVGSGTCSNTPIAPCCGNGTCESTEDCNSCAADCPSSGGGTPGVCGNGVCEPSFGEDCLSCAADCNGKQNGKPANRYCCGDGDGENPVDCSDPRCTGGGNTCGSVGPGTCCGDAFCDPGEECSGCPECPTPPGSETSCSDGVDNDCDGAVDCADTADCPSGIPECPSCGQKNDPCSQSSDCCSLSCKPNGRCR